GRKAWSGTEPEIRHCAAHSFAPGGSCRHSLHGPGPRPRRTSRAAWPLLLTVRSTVDDSSFRPPLSDRLASVLSSPNPAHGSKKAALWHADHRDSKLGDLKPTLRNEQIGPSGAECVSPIPRSSCSANGRRAIGRLGAEKDHSHQEQE